MLWEFENIVLYCDIIFWTIHEYAMFVKILYYLHFSLGLSFYAQAEFSISKKNVFGVCFFLNFATFEPSSNIAVD